MAEIVPDFFLKKLTEEKLQEMNQHVNKELELRLLFLKEALQHMAEAFLFIDLSGVVQVANDAAYKFFSLPTDGTMGQSFWHLFPDDYFGFSMRESLKFGISHRLLYKNHRLLELEISTSYIFIGQP